MDFIICKNCKNCYFCTKTACPECQENNVNLEWNSRKSYVRRLYHGSESETLNKIIDDCLFRGRKSKSFAYLIVIISHYFLLISASLFCLWPIYLKAPVEILGFFLIPAAILTCGLQATSNLKNKVSEDFLEFYRSYTFLVIGLGLFISGISSFFLSIGESVTTNIYGITLFLIPIIFFFIYQIFKSKPDFIFLKAGIKVKGLEGMIPISDIEFAYPVCVDLTVRAISSWHIRIKLKSNPSKKLNKFIRGDTLVIDCNKYAYLPSLIISKFESYNIPMKESITEEWRYYKKINK